MFNFFKKSLRCLIYVEAMGGGLLNKGHQYKGKYEAKILEEANGMYKVKFIDLPIYEPQWIEKTKVELI